MFTRGRIEQMFEKNNKKHYHALKWPTDVWEFQIVSIGRSTHESIVKIKTIFFLCVLICFTYPEVISSVWSQICVHIYLHFIIERHKKLYLFNSIKLVNIFGRDSIFVSLTLT